MPRISRVVVPDLPHHVTQGGSGRHDTFTSEEDRLVYLDLLRGHARRFGARLWAWCLMNNHVHLLAVPDREDSLARTLGRTHGGGAAGTCGRRGSSRAPWSRRAPGWWLGTSRQTPVRAGMVEDAEQWRWSSAAAHANGGDQFNLLDFSTWASEYDCSRWREALRTSVHDEAWQRRLEEATLRGRPLGTETFVKTLAGGMPIGRTFSGR